MNINKIYTGCTIDGKERIMYKSYRYDQISYSVFKDLKTNEEFTYMDIKLDTLVPFKERIFDKKNATRKKVLKVYYTNRRLIYHVDNIFVGDISRVEWVSDIVSDSKKVMSTKIVNKDRVFIKLDDSEYIDLVSNKTYKSEGVFGLSEGDLCVSNIRSSFNELKLDSQLVSKDYVLKKSYKNKTKY